MSSSDSEKIPTLTSTGRIVAITFAILATGLAVLWAAGNFGRTAQGAAVKRPVPDVELVTAAVENVKVTLESQGVVQAVTETRAAAEVPGRIVKVSPSWDAGGTFKEGDELLQIDDADYRAALAQAGAAAAEAALQLRMEEERAAQAIRDWTKLATGKPDSDLVTRQPQLAAAKARNAAAAAAVEKARRDLERTVLRAPYAGRIRATLTDLGSYAAPASPLAEFYATDAYQISLPLSLEDYNMLDGQTAAPIKLVGGAGDQMFTLTAHPVRTGAEIDRASRTIQVIAEIKPGPNPAPLLVPGLFVKAVLSGRILQGVVKLPRVCLFPDNRVAIVSPENKLAFRAVKVARSGRDDVIISEGIKAGEHVLATALAVVTEGMEVNPIAPISVATPASAPETGERGKEGTQGATAPGSGPAGPGP